MKTFLTERDGPDGLYEGPIVYAGDFAAARSAADARGLRVVGELAYAADMAGNILLRGSAADDGE